MSKSIKILKRKGLKFALAYRTRKETRKLQEKHFYQHWTMFYYCIFKWKNSHKFEIYKILKRFHILITNEKTLEFITQHYEEIASWLNSKDFQTKYLDTNHPYPPLLNPNQLTKDSKNPNLSYENIAPELAWDLNLPLPPYYGFIVYGSHGCGHTGLKTLLRYCGIFECYCEPPESLEAKRVYKDYFNKLLINIRQKKLNYLSIINFSTKQSKFYALISSIPSLNLVRDPISMLKAYIGMKRQGKAKREITLHSDINEICHNLVRYDGKLGVTPDIERTKFWIDWKYGCFHDTQLKNALIHLKDSIIIDSLKS